LLKLQIKKSESFLRHSLHTTEKR